MSTNVDNRVVNMEFNNKDFEAGVKQTISSLDKLKASLDLNTTATNMNTNVISMQKSLDNLSINSISTAITNLTDKFSTLGIVGMTAVSNITNKLMDFATNKVTSTIGAAVNQIKTGGWNRASAIEQSRFTLQGLLGDAERVEAAFDKASEAVDGTAYSLDASVSAASQLVASGVDIDTKLGGALKAIAGTAAMTNRDFSDVAHIFTTVAGNGRLMGMQLTQLSTYGLNAAATLGQVGKYAGKTEAEIRDMVSKGQISFQDFSDAMEEAFGDHAKDANNTLTGVLSNIRSALSRIGEVFASGIVSNDDVIKFLNYVRLAINAVKRSVADLEVPFKNLMSAISKFASQFLVTFEDTEKRISIVQTVVDVIKKGIEYMTDFINQFVKLGETIKEEVEETALGETVETLNYTAEQLQKAHDIWEKGLYGNGQTRVDALGDEYQAVQDLVNAFVNGGYSWEAAESMLAQTTEEATDEMTKSTTEVGTAVEDTTQKFSAMSIVVEAIKSFAEGVKKTFNNVKTVASKLVTSFKKVFSWTDLIEDIRDFGKMFSEWSGYFEINEDRASLLERAFSGLSSALKIVHEFFKKIAGLAVTGVGKALSTLLDLVLSLAAKIGDAVASAKEWLEENEILQKVFETLGSAISKTAEFVTEFFEKFKDLPAVQRIKDNLKDLADVVGEKVLTFFTNSADKAGDFFDKLENADTDTVEKVLDKINSALEKMIDLFSDSSTKMGELFGWFDKKEETVNEVANDVTSIASGLGLVKKQGTQITKSDGLNSFIGNLTTNFSSASDGLDTFADKLKEKMSSFDAVKLGIFGVAAAVVTAFASFSYFLFQFGESFKAISSIPQAISGVIKAIALSVTTLSQSIKYNQQAKMFRAFALVIVALAASLAVLYLVVEDTDKMWNIVYALSALLVIITLAVVALSEVARRSSQIPGIASNMQSLALTIVAFSAAVLLLSVAFGVLTQLDYTDIWKPAIAMGAIMLALIGVALVLSKFAPKLVSGGIGLIFFSIAVWNLIKALKTMEGIPYESIADGVFGLLVAMLAISGIAAIASKSSIKGVLSIVLLTACLLLIEYGLQKIIDVGLSWEKVKENIDKFLIVLGALTVLVGAALLLNVTANQYSGKVAASLLAVVLGLAIIVVSLKVLTNMASDANFGTAMTALVAIFLMIVALLAILVLNARTVTDAGKAMMGIATAIGILALVAMALTILDPGEFLKGYFCLVLLSALAAILVFIVDKCESKGFDVKSLYALVTSIAILAAICVILSFIPEPTKLILPAILMCTMLLALGAAMYLVGKEGDKIKRSTIFGMVMTMIVVAGALWALANTVKDPLDLLTAAASIGVVLLSMLAVITGLSKIGEAKFNDKVIKVIALTIAAIMAISAGLAAIVFVSNGNWKSILVAMVAVVAVMVTIAGAIYLIMKVFDKTDSSVTKQRLNLLLEMIAAILAISIALAVLTGAIGSSSSYGPIAAAVGSIIVCLIAMAVAMKVIEEASNNIKVTSLVAFGLMIAAIIAIAFSLKVLSSLDWSNLTSMLIGLAGTLGILVIAMGILGAISDKAPVGLIIAIVAVVAVLFTLAKTIGPIAAGINALVDVINRLTEVNWDGIQLGKLTALVLLLSLLSVGVALCGVALIVFGAGLASVATAALIFAAALALIATGLADILASAASIITAIALIGMTMDNTSDNIETNLIKIGAGLANAIVTFLRTLASNATTIKESLTTIVKTGVEIIFDGINAIVEGILEGIDNLLTILEENGPSIGEKLFNVVLSVLQSLAQYSQIFGYYGAYISMTFLVGVMDGMAALQQDLANSATKLAISALAGFTNAIYENNDALISAFNMLGLTLLRTLVNAFNIKGALDFILEDIDGEIESQRKELEEQGFLNGEKFTLNTVKGGASAEKKAASGMAEITENVTDQSDAAEKGTEKTVDAVQDTYDNKMSNFDVSGTVDKLKDKLDLDFDAAGGEGIMSMFNGMTNKTDSKESRVAVDHIGQSIRQQLIDQGYEYSEDGKYLIKQVQSGMEDEAEDSDFGFDTILDGYDTGAGKMFDQMDTTAEDSKPKGQKVGNYFSEGIIDGIEEYVQRMYEATYGAIDESVVQASKDATEEQSPSKKGIQIGKFWDMGIAIGIDKYTDVITKSSSAMGEAIIASTAAVMSEVNDVINNNPDYQPTLSPVIDTNSIQTASGLINSTFGTNSLGIAANAALSVNDASKNSLAEQVNSLAEQVKRLSDTDYSKLLEGVAINVDASTNVDGTSLRKTSSRYTIQQINNQQRSYIRALGGRA